MKTVILCPNCLFKLREENMATPESLNTLDSTKTIPIPKMVRITEAQLKEALSKYLDYMFDRVDGTYEVKDFDFAFGVVDCHMEHIPRPANEERRAGKSY
jgi:hypothetical protein